MLSKPSKKRSYLYSRVYRFSTLVLIAAAIEGFSQKQITPEELASWNFYGEGTVLRESHGQVLMKEGESRISIPIRLEGRRCRNRGRWVGCS